MSMWQWVQWAFGIVVVIAVMLGIIDGIAWIINRFGAWTEWIIVPGVIVAVLAIGVLFFMGLVGEFFGRDQ